MQRHYGAARGATSGVSLRLYVLRHVRAELCAGADAELLIGASEIRLHRLRAHEEGGCDLAVRQPLGRELGHAALALGQVATGCTPPQANALELCSRTV